jgi:hypothetical protein
MLWFLSLEIAVEKIEAWRKNYNGFRPHSSLNKVAMSAKTLACKKLETGSIDRITISFPFGYLDEHQLNVHDIMKYQKRLKEYAVSLASQIIKGTNI